MSSEQATPDEDESDVETVENRSEIVYLLDAQDANPNGNPLSPSNKPRRDPATGQGIISDVRLKRYIRDQLAAEGKGVYIDNIRTDKGNKPTRVELAKEVADVDSEDDIGNDFLSNFLDIAIDVRYFGATFSFSTNNNDIAEALSENLPPHLTGPVQISPGRSLHRVRANEGYNSLTAVISNPDEDSEENEGKKQGGFDLDDHRIVYGIYGFGAVINEHNAEDSRLRKSDVKKLDKLFWKSVKNQANSRSKRGQHPRLYLRVEYDEGFHKGNLDRTLELGSQSEDVDQITDVRDVTVEIGDLIDELTQNSVKDRIKKIHVLQDKRLKLESNGEVIDSTLPDHIESELNVDVHRISLNG